MPRCHRSPPLFLSFSFSFVSIFCHGTCPFSSSCLSSLHSSSWHFSVICALCRPASHPENRFREKQTARPRWTTNARGLSSALTFVRSHFRMSYFCTTFLFPIPLFQLVSYCPSRIPRRSLTPYFPPAPLPARVRKSIPLQLLFSNAKHICIMHVIMSCCLTFFQKSNSAVKQGGRKRERW